MGVLNKNWGQLLEGFISRFRHNLYAGDYATWQEALSQCSRYDAPDILEKVKNATLKVKNGEAVYERDSMLFDKIEYSWPLLADLMHVAAVNKGRLNVVDFGGSLGSSYFQNRRFLSGLKVTWNIVDQKSFVACGRELIQDDVVHFYESVDEYIGQQGVPDILITSCTLPYIERPYELIQSITHYGIPYLCIDNTPFNYENRDRLTVQKIPSAIYATSGLPCWLLSYESLKSSIMQQYDLIAEHRNDLYIYIDGKKVPYQGFFARLK